MQLFARKNRLLRMTRVKKVLVLNDYKTRLSS
jgi:hypothetical protein